MFATRWVTLYGTEQYCIRVLGIRKSVSYANFDHNIHKNPVLLPKTRKRHEFSEPHFSTFYIQEYIVFALHEAADVGALHDDFFCEF